MPNFPSPLDLPAQVVQIEAVLKAHDYRVRRVDSSAEVLGADFLAEQLLLAEDAFGFVVCALYEDWKTLHSEWMSLQQAIVTFVGGRILPDDPKAFEGYLALFTRAVLDADEADQAHQIRHDTSRIRKLVTTGTSLVAVADIERALRPVLPLKVEAVDAGAGDIFDVLPGVMADRGHDESAIVHLVDAFRRQEPLVDRLHAHWSSSAD